MAGGVLPGVLFTRVIEPPPNPTRTRTNIRMKEPVISLLRQPSPPWHIVVPFVRVFSSHLTRVLRCFRAGLGKLMTTRVRKYRSDKLQVRRSLIEGGILNFCKQCCKVAYILFNKWDNKVCAPAANFECLSICPGTHVRNFWLSSSSSRCSELLPRYLEIPSSWRPGTSPLALIDYINYVTY